MYAGATWDFHRYHYDADFVGKLGMPAPFMDGQMVGALYGASAHAMGRRRRLRTQAQLSAARMVYAGDSIAFRGRYPESVEEGRALVSCTLTVTKPDGPKSCATPLRPSNSGGARPLNLWNQNDRPMTALSSTSRWAAAASFSGRVRSTIGRTAPADTRRSAISSWRREVLTALRISSPRR